eukprot:4645271-Pleurochrysis_carterae.AAC.1
MRRIQRGTSADLFRLATLSGAPPPAHNRLGTTTFFMNDASANLERQFVHSAIDAKTVHVLQARK